MTVDEEGFQEQLWPSRGTWLLPVIPAAATFLMVTPLGAPTWSWLLAAAALLLGLGAVLGSSPKISVSAGVLRAGKARIPVQLLGPATTVQGPELAQLRGRGHAALSYWCHRSGLPAAVVLPVVDPLDPTPYWLVSTRRPQQLTAALAQAHSKHSG